MKRFMVILLIFFLASSPFLNAFADRIPEEKGPRYIGAMQVIRCQASKSALTTMARFVYAATT